MPKKYAIISDIHGNLAALKAVLADINKMDVKEIWCLGDMVGYGPQPIECYKLITEVCDIVIKGNHENALPPGGGLRFNARAKRSIEWTRAVLAAAPGGSEILQKIADLPTRFEKKDMMFVHGSPAEPTEEYLMPRDATKTRKMKPQFDLMKHYAFVGHTHYPGVIEEGEAFSSPEDMMLLVDKNVYMLDGMCKAIINVGSVGQPRDKNPKSCYVIFDGEMAEYHRVSYDARVTQKLIHEIPHLDNFLGDRIVEGK